MTEAGNRLADWKGPRTAEFTGGYKPREMSNYPDLQTNPNDDNDGLSHHGRTTREDQDSRDQSNKEKRREKALRELIPGLRHISIRTAVPNDNLANNPMLEQENKMLESGLGVDIGANGLSISAGRNVGSVRSDTPFITYGHPSRGMIRASNEVVTSDLLKARRKYKGRKYEEDEESDEDERKSKAKRRRQKKRRGRKKGFAAKGGRQPKSATKRRASAVARQLDRASPRQSFAPNIRSLPLRTIGSTNPGKIPLRIRDPVAYQRKLANEKMRRLQGALPRAITRHRSSADTGITESGTRGLTIGDRPSTQRMGMKMPSTPKLGTSMSAGAKHDALMSMLAQGSEFMKSSDSISKKKGLTRLELLSLKNKVERMLKRLEKLTKATPELDHNAKIGNQASPERASAPTGGTEVNDEEKAAFRFDDTSLALGSVGKR